MPKIRIKSSTSGAGNITASEGLEKVGNDIQLGSPDPITKAVTLTGDTTNTFDLTAFLTLLLEAGSITINPTTDNFLTISGFTINWGTGSPEGVVTANPGSFYGDDSGTGNFWFKQSGVGNTGWINLTNVYTVNNGLSESPAGNFQLGGTLVKDTTISTSTFELYLDGSSSSGVLLINNTNTGASSSANALSVTGATSSAQTLRVLKAGASADGGVALLEGQYPGAASALRKTILDIRRTQFGSSGATGIGADIRYVIENAAGTNTACGNIAVLLSDATNAVEKSDFLIELISLGSATLAERLRLKGANGQLQLNAYGSGTITGTPTRLLAVTAAGNVIETTYPGSYTYRNGLTESPAGTVELGGTLLHDTTIDGTATGYTLLIENQGTGATDYALHALNNSGVSNAAPAFRAEHQTAGVAVSATAVNNSAVSAVSTNSFGISARSDNGAAAAVHIINGTSTNTVETSTVLRKQVSGGVGANGAGVAAQFETEDNAGTAFATAKIIAVADDVTAGATNAYFQIQAKYSAGGLQAALTLNGTGAATLDQYGSGTFTGTPVHPISVDSSGNVIEDQLITSGNVSTSTDGSGDITVTHNLPDATFSAVVTPTGTTPYVVTVHNKTATTFDVRFFDTAGAAVVSTAVTFDWIARDV